LNVRRTVTRPLGLVVSATIALAVAIGGIGSFRSAPADAAVPLTGVSSVEVALGVTPTAASLTTVADKTDDGSKTVAPAPLGSTLALPVALLRLDESERGTYARTVVAPRTAARPKSAAARAATAAPGTAKSVTKRRTSPKAKKHASAEGKSLPTRLSNRAQARRKAAPTKAKKKTHGYGGPPPSARGGAERWRPVVRWYLKRYGVWSRSFEDKAIHIMKGESGGDPRCRTGSHLGLYQFDPGWMSTADRLNPYTSICRFVLEYKRGGIRAIRRPWAQTFN
jgi:hypothetical protein